MPQIAIRPVQLTDWSQWLPLWEGYNEGTASDEATRMTWQRFLDREEPVHALVAGLDGRLVGTAHFIFHRDTSVVRSVCFLQDLFTSPDARGRGVGRALIEAVCAVAEEGGSPHIYWRTHQTNTRAMALYDTLADRSGLVQYRRQPSPRGDAL